MTRSSERKSTWSEQVTLTLDQRAFSFYDVGKQDWSAEPGECSILAGSLSADIKLQRKYLLTNGQETY
jgi:beta-glucosidase